MTELNRALAANLKFLRQRWGFSQADLAERSDISVGYVGDIEVGVKWPSAEILERLASSLHVKAYQLLLNPEETQLYLAWLERRDLVVEMGEKIWAYFEKKQR